MTFGRPELTVDEGVGNFTMCVTLDRETLQPVTVTIEARDGSAVSPGGTYNHSTKINCYVLQIILFHFSI